MRMETEVGRVTTRSRAAVIDGRDQHRRAEDQAAEIDALRAEVRRLTALLARVGTRLYPHLDQHARVLR
jgi:hypothetical protein